MRKGVFFVVVLVLVLIPVVSASDFGYDNPNLPKVDKEEVIVTTITNINNTNSSDYWDNLDTFNTTQMEDSGGTLNILVSWLESLFILDTDEGNLNVNSSNYWDNYNVVGDLPHDSLSGAGTVDTWQEIDIFVNESGDTMTGNLNMGSNNITNVWYTYSEDFYVGNYIQEQGDSGTFIQFPGDRHIHTYAGGYPVAEFIGGTPKGYLLLGDGLEEVDFIVYGSTNQKLFWVDSVLDTVNITGSFNVIGNGNFTGNISASYYFGDGSKLTNIAGGNLSWNQSFANTLYAPNTTFGIQQLINSTGIYSTYNATYAAGSTIWDATFNSSFDDRDSDTTYSDLSEFNDDIFAGFNHTLATYNLWNTAWLSTYNATYDNYALNVSLNYSKMVFNTWDSKWSAGTLWDTTFNASFDDRDKDTIFTPTNVAWINQSNTFALDQTFNGDILMTDDDYIGISGAERIQFDSDGDDIEIMGGNVGIGTTNPGEKLEVVGDVNISGAGGTIGRTTLANAWLKIGTTLGMDDNELYFETPAYIGTLGANDLSIDTAGTTRILIDGSTGDVQIVNDLTITGNSLKDSGGDTFFEHTGYAASKTVSSISAEGLIGYSNIAITGSQVSDDGTFVLVAGDTMAGTLNMGNNPITNIDWASSDDGAGSGLDADKLDGWNLATASTVSTVVGRDGSGDINARLFKSEYDSTNPTVNYIMTQIDTASNNYMRPSTVAQVKAKIIPTYDTGWVSNSDWTNQHLGTAVGGNVVHNLNAPLSDVLVKVLISPTGADSDSFEVGTGFRDTSVGGYNCNFMVYHVDNNNIKVQTGLKGIIQTADDGTHVYIDIENWYYKIKVYKLG